MDTGQLGTNRHVDSNYPGRRKDWIRPASEGQHDGNAYSGQEVVLLHGTLAKYKIDELMNYTSFPTDLSLTSLS